MSSGVIIGIKPSTPLRLNRGTTRLPIGSSEFLNNISISGDTFQLQDTGVHVLLVTIYPSGSELDTPFLLELFDETTQTIVAAYFAPVIPASAPAGQAYNIPVNVTSPTDFYSLRIKVWGGGGDQYAMNLTGHIFNCVVMPLVSGGGTPPNYLVRGFNAPATPNFPPLPQPYMQLYVDANNIWYGAAAGQTNWTIINTGATIP